MSMYYSMGWSLDMVAGRGFIALAAQAMGAGEPVGSMLSALVFGFAQAFSIKVSSRGIDSNLVTPIPYLVTILGLVVTALAKNAGTALIQPIALVCIGGLLYATLMTLFVVPCMYDMMNKKELRKVDDSELELLDI